MDRASSPDGQRLPDPDRVDGILGDDLAARLERWAAAARVDEAAGRRSREQWLRQQAEEEGSLRGALTDLAESGLAVAVHARNGRIHHGRIRAVGEDFVALAGAGQADVLVALDAVNVVVSRSGEAVAIGREVRARLSLTQVVVGLCARRERVALVLSEEASPVAGTLRSVGRDLVVLRVDGQPGRPTAYVPLASITEVVLS